MVRETDNKLPLDLEITGDVGQSTIAISDEQLLAQTASGDEQAFCELYYRYSKPLYNYLYRLVHDTIVAEDLLQEVYLAVWTGAGRYRGQAKVKTWLFRITHNQAVSWLRKSRISQSYDDLGVVSPDNSPEDQVVSAYMTDQIQLALNRLSPKHRSVLELVFAHDMSYAEIALVTQCPIGTVKSRINQALHLVSGFLKDTST